jgi:DNA-binding transcriptional MerR regulator
MLRIGDFAKLGQVSVRTLRFYDERGLLKPRRIDAESGYRYYSIEQMPRLNRILALKDLGLSLEQIAGLLETDLPAAQLRGMLRLKHAELQQRIQDEQTRLAQVEARLQQIEHEQDQQGYDVVLKAVGSQLVASIREPIATYQDVGNLTAEIYAYLQELRVNGIEAAIWHNLDQPEHGLDAEGVVPLPHAVPATQRIRVYLLPGAERMASVIHHGPYNTLYRAYAVLGRWIEANGYAIVGPARDIYLQGGDDQDDASCVTEIQFPVERR